MKKFILTFAFLSFFLFGYSQKELQNHQIIRLGIGYFGELPTHPGLVIFGEFAVNQKQNQILFKTNLIYYRHQKYSNNWAILPEVVFRKHVTNNYYFDGSVGLGWFYENPDGDNLDFTNIQAFSLRDKGWHYALPSIAIRMGKQFDLVTENPFFSSIGLRGMYQTTFSGVGLWRSAVDIEMGHTIKQ